MEMLRKNLPIITLGILIVGLLAYIDNRFGRLETEMRAEIKDVRGEIKDVRGEIKDVKIELTARMDRMEARMDRTDAKIDRLSDKMDTLILSLSNNNRKPASETNEK